MRDLFDLSGKIALVTGASSGMGKAIAEAMGLHGARVVVSSNDVEGCHATVRDFTEKGIAAHAIPCDMGRPDEVDQLASKTLGALGHVDILVSCVGMAPAGPFLGTDAQTFETTLHLNLESAWHLTQQLLPGMMARREGVLIYLASIAAVRGNKNIGLYGVSKAGLVQMARNLAVEFGPHNIRANTISPGMIDTPFSKSLMEDELFMQKRLSLTPLRRVGTPAEIAGVSVMLASKAGAFITGQNIIVDGGTIISDGI